MKFLHDRGIVYKRNPISDVPTASYPWGDFYEYGTYQYFSLFQSRAKINTYKSLKWHLCVLWYLNDHLYEEDFEQIAWVVSQKENGFTTFSPDQEDFQKIFEAIKVIDLNNPPRPKVRKLIFKDNIDISFKEKMKIVGSMIGRTSITPDDIYHVIEELHDGNTRITVGKIAEALGCSTRTVHRHLTPELKKYKSELNKLN